MSLCYAAAWLHHDDDCEGEHRAAAWAAAAAVPQPHPAHARHQQQQKVQRQLERRRCQLSNRAEKRSSAIAWLVEQMHRAGHAVRHREMTIYPLTVMHGPRLHVHHDGHDDHDDGAVAMMIRESQRRRRLATVKEDFVSELRRLSLCLLHQHRHHVRPGRHRALQTPAACVYEPLGRLHHKVCRSDCRQQLQQQQLWRLLRLRPPRQALARAGRVALPVRSLVAERQQQQWSDEVARRTAARQRHWRQVRGRSDCRSAVGRGCSMADPMRQCCHLSPAEHHSQHL